MPWWTGTVIYQLIVRSYADGNGDGIGDFKGLASRLPYLRWLGVKTLWLTPIYPSPLRDGGYDITDFTGIHPDLGDLAAFHRFLTAAHGQGMRVILDLVLNHTSDLHPWFQRARWAAKGSPERDVYVWSDDPTRYSDAPVLFRHFESSNWEWDPVAEQYYLHRFLRHQPDLNYANPAVQDAMLDVVDLIQTIRVGLPQGQGHWLNWGINRRLAPLLNGDPRSNRLLHGLLYSLPGMPCLYYGDELGMGDWPGLRDRDPNRTPMAWTPARNGGFSTAPDPLLVLPPITAPGYDYRVVNVEVQKQLPGSLLNWHRRMLTCRRLLPALRHGSFRLLHSPHPGVLVYLRCTEAMTVLVAANVTAAGASLSLDLVGVGWQRTREVMWGCEFPPASPEWFVNLPPYGFNWWLIGEVDAEA